MASSSSSSQTSRRNRRIGSSCHHCKHTKPDDQVVVCTAIHGGRRCSIKICDRCLLFRYGLEKNMIAPLNDWHCPRCRGVCNCAACLIKEGKTPIKNINCRKRKHQTSDHESEMPRTTPFAGVNLQPEEVQEEVFCGFNTYDPFSERLWLQDMRAHQQLGEGEARLHQQFRCYKCCLVFYQVDCLCVLSVPPFMIVDDPNCFMCALDTLTAKLNKNNHFGVIGYGLPLSLNSNSYPDRDHDHPLEEIDFLLPSKVVSRLEHASISLEQQTGTGNMVEKQTIQ
ncbi:hypothetical protein ACFE04_004666 [Oxalis oulophora]